MSANKLLGQWNYSGLAAEVRQTHQRIDLLQKIDAVQFSLSYELARELMAAISQRFFSGERTRLACRRSRPFTF